MHGCHVRSAPNSAQRIVRDIEQEQELERYKKQTAELHDILKEMIQKTKEAPETQQEKDLKYELRKQKEEADKLRMLLAEDVRNRRLDTRSELLSPSSRSRRHRGRARKPKPEDEDDGNDEHTSESASDDGHVKLEMKQQRKMLNDIMELVKKRLDDKQADTEQTVSKSKDQVRGVNDKMNVVQDDDYVERKQRPVADHRAVFPEKSDYISMSSRERPLRRTSVVDDDDALLHYRSRNQTDYDPMYSHDNELRRIEQRLQMLEDKQKETLYEIKSHRRPEPICT